MPPPAQPDLANVDWETPEQSGKGGPDLSNVDWETPAATGPSPAVAMAPAHGPSAAPPAPPAQPGIFDVRTTPGMIADRIGRSPFGRAVSGPLTAAAEGVMAAPELPTLSLEEAARAHPLPGEAGPPEPVMGNPTTPRQIAASSDAALGQGIPLAPPPIALAPGTPTQRAPVTTPGIAPPTREQKAFGPLAAASAAAIPIAQGAADLALVGEGMAGAAARGLSIENIARLIVNPNTFGQIERTTQWAHILTSLGFAGDSIAQTTDLVNRLGDAYDRGDEGGANRIRGQLISALGQAGILSAGALGIGVSGVLNSKLPPYLRGAGPDTPLDVEVLPPEPGQSAEGRKINERMGAVRDDQTITVNAPGLGAAPPERIEGRVEPPEAPPAPTPPPPPESVSTPPETESEAPPATTAGEKAPNDRRTDTDTRKRVEEMTSDERAKALLTDEQTGLPNRRAYNEDTADQAFPAVGYSDVDGLKAINDASGYDAGDALIRAKATALRQAVSEHPDALGAYRDKGDEFITGGLSAASLESVYRRAREILAGATISWENPDGTEATLSSPASFSYGIGASLSEANAALHESKAARIASGERPERGVSPGNRNQPGNQVGEARPPGQPESPAPVPAAAETETAPATEGPERGAGKPEPAPPEQGPVRGVEKAPLNEDVRGYEKTRPATIETRHRHKGVVKVGAMVKGDFGVHPDLEGEEGKFTVTHLPSGYAAVHGLEPGEAAAAHEEAAKLPREVTDFKSPSEATPEQKKAIKDATDRGRDTYANGQSEAEDAVERAKDDASSASHERGRAIADHVDRALHQALNSFTGSALRWDGHRKTGLDDDQMKAAIANEFGIRGGRSSDEAAEKAGWGYVDFRGGKNPRFTLEPGSQIQEGVPARKPLTLQGPKLIAAARRVLGIKKPEEGRPEPHTAEGVPSELTGAELGPRWHYDAGHIPGEPLAHLDADENGENGKAALIDHRNEEGTEGIWGAHLADGTDLGRFSKLEDAARAAEKAVDESSAPTKEDNRDREEHAGGIAPEEGAPDRVAKPVPEPEGEGETQGVPRRSGEGGGGKVRRPRTGGTEPAGGAGGVDQPKPSTPGTREPGPRRVEPRTEGQQPTSADTGLDYRIDDPADLVPKGPKDRVRRNIEAIRTLRAIMADGGRPATAAEQATMARFTGWGAVAQDVFAQNRQGFEAERREIKDLLSPEEYEAARNSTVNAHYTAPQVVSAMWDAMRQMGFEGGRVLEPSMGVGYFFGLMPPDARAASRLTGVELDRITGGIARALYPKANVQIKGFQELKIPDGFFDLAISNVPFGDYRVYDPDKRYRDVSGAIHDYFFVKSLDKVRPGGMVAFITSHFTMDKASDSVRQEIAKRADLVAALRLPGGAFQENAGTSVVTDVLFLKRRPDGTPAAGEKWMDTATWNATDKYGGLVSEPRNEYFSKHRKHVLGTEAASGRMYGSGGGYNVEPKGTFAADLADAISKLPRGAFEERTTPASFEPAAVTSAPGTKDGGIFEKDGKLFVKDGDTAVEHTVSPAEAEKIKGLLGIRDAIREVYDAQLSGKAADGARKRLNEVYDKFVRKHGTIAKNIGPMKYDPDAPMIQSIENVDPKTKKATKADIFTKDTVRSKQTVERASNPSDAVAVSLSKYGRLNLPEMVKLFDNMSPEELGQRLVEEGLAYNSPSEGWQHADRYLTGNVRRKLIEAQEAARADPQYEPNVTALEKVQPPDLEAADIEPRLGTTWIPPQDVAAFLADMVDGKPRWFSVDYIPPLAKWSVSTTASERYEGTTIDNTIRGTRRVPFIKIVQGALDGSPPRVYDRGNDDKPVLNPAETALAADKVAELHREFDSWIWKDDDRRERLVRYYNDNMNNVVKPKFDVSHYKGKDGQYHVPGMSPNVKLREAQVRFAWLSVSQPEVNPLAAWEVGTGKTMAQILAAMEYRRLGLRKKVAIAFPKQVILQATATAREMYPGAKILSTVDSFERKERKATVAKIASGDWDLVVMTHEHLKTLPMRPEYVASFLREQLDELNAFLTRLKEEKGEKDRTVKQLTKRALDYKAKLEELLAEKWKDDAVSFEQTGIDHLIIDEAHKFKSVPIFSTMENVKGVPTSTSQRALNMVMVSRYLHEMNGGGGLTFCTGTPISNTIAELYNIQRYLQPKELSERGIHEFDAWQKQFTATTTKQEISMKGTYRPVTRLNTFVNIPELQALTRQAIDVVFADDVPGLKRPKRVVIPVEVPVTPNQARIFRSLMRRAQVLKPPKKGEKPADHIFKIIHEGKLATIDPRLVEPDLPEERTKLSAAVEIILRELKERPGTTSLVFSDTAIHPKKAEKPVVDAEDPDEEDDPYMWQHGGRFSIFDEMRKKLVAGGVPEDKIADFSTLSDINRAKAIDGLNGSGKWVAFGGTDRLGTGVNCQRHVGTIIHIDVPPRPDSLEQREGRGWRHGNELAETGGELRIYPLIATGRGSFDEWAWNLVDSKKKFIRQYLRGKVVGRKVVFDDPDNMDASKWMSIASGNPDVQRRVDLEAEISDIERRAREHDRKEHRLRDGAVSVKREIAQKEQRLGWLEQDKATAHENRFDEGEFHISVGGKAYTDRMEASKALMNEGHAAQMELEHGSFGESIPIGKYRGFELAYFRKEGGQSGTYAYSASPEALHGFASSFDPDEGEAKPIASLNGSLTAIGNRIEAVKKGIATAQREGRQIAEQIGKPFGEADRLAAASKELGEVLGRLSKTDLAGNPDAVGEEPARDFLRSPGSGTKLEARAAPGAVRKTAPPPAPSPAPPRSPIQGNPGKPASALTKAARAFVESKTEAQRLFNPISLTPESRLSGQMFIPRLAELARRDQMFAAEMVKGAWKGARAYFDREMTPRERLESYDRAEDGLPQANARLDTIYRGIRRVLDERRSFIQKHGRLKTYIEDYLPHIWERPTDKKTIEGFKEWFGRRPLEGNKSFLKQRKIPRLLDGVDNHGLYPVSDNPIDLVQIQLHQMDKYDIAHRLLKDHKDVGLAKFVPVGGDAPASWRVPKSGIFTVYGNPNIPINEAFDPKRREAIEKMIEALGATQERAPKSGGPLGYVEHGVGPYSTKPPHLFTRFATPDEAMTHELGHVIDEQLFKKDPRLNVIRNTILRRKPYAEELRKLADARYDGLPANDPFKKYVRTENEKIANLVHAYVHAPELLKSLAPKTAKLFATLINSTPALKGLDAIKPSLQFEEGNATVSAGGAVIHGHYFMPREVADLFDNFLSPGLGQYAWYRGASYFNNLMLRFQLGMSAYHLTFTSVDAAVNRLATAMEAVTAGNYVRAAKDLGSWMVPGLPAIQDVIRGNRLFRDYLSGNTEINNSLPDVASLVDAGGRVSMDRLYRLNGIEKWLRAVRNDDKLGILAHALPAAVEAIAKPLMEWYVPRLKAGAYLHMMDAEYERRGVGATRREMAKVRQEVWRRVEDRFGQLTTDNLLWKPVVRDSLHIAFRAMGWYLGFGRDTLGAIPDAVAVPKRTLEMVRRKKAGRNFGWQDDPVFSHKISHAFALPLTLALYGGLLTYLATGGWPRKKEDYFLLKLSKSPNAKVRMIASYLKDILEFRDSPIHYLTSRVAPIVDITHQWLTNETWSHHMIDEPGDSVIQRLESHLATLGESGTPLSLKQGGDTGTFMGVPPAPRFLTRTPSERVISDYFSQQPSAPLTREQVKQRDTRRTVTTDERAARDSGRAIDFSKETAAGEAAGMTRRQIKMMEHSGVRHLDSESSSFNRLPVKDALEAYAAGNAAEQTKFLPLLRKKVLRSGYLRDSSPEEASRVRKIIFPNAGAR